MEDLMSLSGNFDASYTHLQHTHMMHLQGSAALEPASSPGPPPSNFPLLPLHSSAHDSSQLYIPIISPLPLSAYLPSQHSGASKAHMDVHTEHRSSNAWQTDGKLCMDPSYEEVELELSLRTSGRHQELIQGVLSQAAGDQAADQHSTSSNVTELVNRSDDEGLAATELAPYKASFLGPIKLCELGASQEITSSSSHDHRLADYAKSHENVGDFNELCPTATGPSGFQAKVDKSQVFPFAMGAQLPADGDFPFLMESLPADSAFAASHEEKVFFCKYCDRRFYSSQALGGHQNAHKRERLVVRSSSLRFGPPAIFSCVAVPGSNLPFQVPSASMHQHLNGVNEESPLSAYNNPLTASMCRDRPIASLPHLQGLSMCKERTPPLSSMASNSKPAFNCLSSGNVYIKNRSLGIKAHSLVHKPALGHSSAHQMGHCKANINAIYASADRATATYHGWPRAYSAMDAQRSAVARYFTLGQDQVYNVQQKSLYPSDEISYAHPRAGLAANSVKVQGGIESDFLCNELIDSSSTKVDLALHL